MDKKATASKGMPEMKTKKQLKKLRMSSTAGKDKGENCHATPLDKAMAKYPRSYRTASDEYFGWTEKKKKLLKA